MELLRPLEEGTNDAPTRAKGGRRRAEPALVGLVEGGQTSATLRLRGRLVRSVVPAIRAAWREFQLLDTLAPTLDLTGVRCWDVAGVATLLEAASHLAGLEVIGAPAALGRALARAGLNVPDQAGALPRRETREPWPVIDAALAFVVLVFMAPVLLLVALAIVLDSPGPIFYTQLRAGQRDSAGRVRIFPIFKFRTMVADADAQRVALRGANAYGTAGFFKVESDPRVTRVGRFLRAWSLDEFPQFVNVMRGEMRLVGNRPLPLDEAVALTEPWQRIRFDAPAGITGIWQISARSEVGARARMALDTAYAVCRTRRLDCAILVGTVPALVNRKGW